MHIMHMLAARITKALLGDPAPLPPPESLRALRGKSTDEIIESLRREQDETRAAVEEREQASRLQRRLTLNVLRRSADPHHD
jgi:hypothetical protein